MKTTMVDSFFELSATDNRGRQVPMASYAGKVVLVVNTASTCGFTPQYKGLEALYRKYRDRGLVVLGFPCDQFAHQEPGSDAEIASFCQINFGVTFPLMSKVEVNGKGTHPVFAFLKAKTAGILGGTVKWNFTKFLVGRDGKTVRRFSPATEPEKLVLDIEEALSA
jgi:glutathione peroxidase